MSAPDARNSHRSSLGQQIRDLASRDREGAAFQALQAFMSPPRVPPTETELAFLKGTSSIPAAKVEDIRIPELDYPIRTYTWEPQSQPHGNTKPPTILLSHGYAVTALSSFVPLFITHLLSLPRSYRLLTWDQPAHGSSGGTHSLLISIKHIIHHVLLQPQNQPLAAIIGSSIGKYSPRATTALLTLSLHPSLGPRVPKLIGLSTPTGMRGPLTAFLHRLNCTDLNLIDTMVSGARERKELIPDAIRDFVSPGRRAFPDMEVLLVQDWDDEVTTVEEARYYERSLARSKVLLTKGLRHYGNLRDERVVKVVGEFLERGLEGLDVTPIWQGEGVRGPKGKI